MGNFYASYPVLASGGGGGGVSSINTLTGAVNLLAGTGITITPSGQNLTIAATGGSGTVTSVALADSTGLFNITGSPVTTSGTLTLASFQNQAANTFLAGPPGTPVTGTPAFRGIVNSDVTSITTLPNLVLPVAQVTGAANTALSNLIATSINQTLSPNAPSTFDLGDSTNFWSSVWAGQILAPSGNTLGIEADAIQLLYDVSTLVIQSSSTGKTVVFDGATVSMGSQRITNVVNPTAQQDAATKNYVDTTTTPKVLTTAGDLIFENATPATARLPIGTAGQVLTVSGGLPSWQTPSTGGTVTSVSVVSANGLAGTVATATTTPAITLSTTITGLLKGNGTAISAAVSGTDYVIPSGSITGTASNVTGIVAVANGGTGLATLTAHNVLIGNAAGNVAFAAPSTAGFVLTSNGPSADPTFQAAGSGAFLPLAGGTMSGNIDMGNNQILDCNSLATLSIQSFDNVSALTIAGAPSLASPNAEIILQPSGAINFTASTMDFGGSNFTSVGTITSNTDATYDLGATSNEWKSLWLAPTTSATDGMILQNNLPWIHSFGAFNFFAGGPNQGNFTLTGTHNIAIGDNNLGSTTTGSNNIALGDTSLNLVQDGSINIAIGNDVLANNVSGQQNIGIGLGALSLSTADFLVAIGGSALSANTTGTTNTAVGNNTLPNNQTGTDNTAFGDSAGSGGFPIVGGQNTFVGSSARMTSGDYNGCTLIGYSASVNGDNSIAIGNSAVALAANQTAIGNSGTTDTFLAGGVSLGLPSTFNTHSLNTNVATNGAGVGTITNLPTGFSGNPTGYISININGSPHVIPYW